MKINTLFGGLLVVLPLLFSCTPESTNVSSDGVSGGSAPTSIENPVYPYLGERLLLGTGGSAVELYENAAATDLLGLLPLETEIGDADGYLAIGLPRSLSLSGMGVGYTPYEGSFCYQTRERELRLFEDAGEYSPYLVAIGELDGDLYPVPGETVLSLEGSEGGSSETPAPEVGTDSLVHELLEDGSGYRVVDVGDNDFEIVIPETYEGLPVLEISGEYGTGVFARKEITSVVIPDNLRLIGQNSFNNCSSLVRVEIGVDSSLTEIGRNAFSGCTSLETIFIPEGVSLIGDSAFNNCSGLNRIEVDEGNARYSDLGNCLVNMSTMEIVRASNAGTVEEGILSIGTAAFRRASLTSVHIPASLESIGNYAFDDTALLSGFTVDSDNAHFSAQGGILYDKAMENIVEVPEALSGSVTLPATLVEIPRYAFDGVTGVSEVAIPEGNALSNIGFAAFRGLSLTIRFGGTREEWEAIPKNSNWDNGALSISVVCSDD